MAQINNVFDTYDAQADREQLSNVIYNISPTATPFMSSIGKNSIKNVVFDWQTEALPTVDATGEIEGFRLDGSTSASTATVRKTNVAMISKRDATVSGSQETSDPAGKKSEMAHQLAIMAKALKRDMETALLSNVAKSAGNATTARKLGGCPTWYETNVDAGAGGSGAGNGAIRTDGTQRAFTEDQLKGILVSCYNEGGNPNMIMVNAFNKQ